MILSPKDVSGYTGMVALKVCKKDIIARKISRTQAIFMICAPVAKNTKICNKVMMIIGRNKVPKMGSGIL